MPAYRPGSENGTQLVSGLEGERQDDQIAETQSRGLGDHDLTGGGADGDNHGSYRAPRMTAAPTSDLTNVLASIKEAADAAEVQLQGDVTAIRQSLDQVQSLSVELTHVGPALIEALTLAIRPTVGPRALGVAQQASDALSGAAEALQRELQAILERAAAARARLNPVASDV